MDARIPAGYVPGGTPWADSLGSGDV